MLEALLSSSEWAGTTYSHLIELWRPLIPVYKMPDTHHSSLFHTHTALPVPFWLTILKNSSMVSSLLLFKMKLLPGGRAECENQTYSPVENVSIEMATSCIYTCLFLIWCFGNYFASRSPLSINCWRLGRCIRREEEQINALFLLHCCDYSLIAFIGIQDAGRVFSIKGFSILRVLPHALMATPLQFLIDGHRTNAKYCRPWNGCWETTSHLWENVLKVAHLVQYWMLYKPDNDIWVKDLNPFSQSLMDRHFCPSPQRIINVYAPLRVLA